MPLAGPRAVELDQVPGGIRQIEDETHRGGEAEGVRPVVADPGAPRDGRHVAEDRVRQRDDEVRRLVGEIDLERLRLVIGLGVGRRQARDRGLAGCDAVLAIAELEDGRSVSLLDDQARHAIVAAARRRVLEGDRIAEPVREPRERTRQQMAIRTAGRESGAQVEEPQGAALVDREDVAQPAVREVELAGVGIPLDHVIAGAAPGRWSTSIRMFPVR